MTEKHEYVAAIRRKGLENTGVTADVAKKMYNTLERKTLAIVEVEHKRQINDADTGRGVELVIIAFEPSQDDALDDHLRQLMRTLHQNRVLHSEGQQLTIDTSDDVEPSVADVVAAQKAHEANVPHPYDPGEDSEPGDDACVLCGEEIDHELHAVATEPEPAVT